jgi:exodeoxyribonuclease V beta subunit
MTGAEGKPVLIEASAGTGKTYALERLVVELVAERGAKLEEILVVTFTEKATAELRERVRTLFETLLAGDTLDETRRERLRAARASWDGANIFTIHAFCQRLLTEHAFLHQRLFAEEQVDGRTAFGEAFREVLRKRLSVEPATRALTTAWLSVFRVDELEQHLWKCLGAHAELRPGYDAALIEPARERFLALGLDGPTLHRLKLGTRYLNDRLLDLYHLCAATRGNGAALLAEIERAERERYSSKFISFILEKLTGGKNEAAEATLGLIRAAPPLHAAVAAHLLPPVEERLAARKRESGAYDFDDMLRLVDESLAGPGGPALTELLRARYRFALIDEFQDTDPVQWRIFERLFLTPGDAQRGLYLIGDPKQAIYGFRGGDVHTYVTARRTVGDAGGERVSLATCYRATGPLIGALNAIFDQRAMDPFFDGDIRYDEPVACGRSELCAVDARGQDVAPVTLLAVPTARADGTTPVRFARRRHSAAIAAEIHALLGGSLRVGERGRERRLQASDIFILTRTLGEGEEIGRALRAAAVPHAFYKQDGLFDTDEARHVRDLLCAIEDPHYRSARNAAFATPFFGLQLGELLGCDALPSGHPLGSRLSDWRALAERQEWETLFAQILHESGVARRALFGQGGERALTNYQHLFELLLEEAARTRPTLRDLVARLRAFIDDRARPEGENGTVQRLESDRDAVQIMTMHKAKGLEAEVVFLYGGLANARYSRVSVFHEAGRRVAWLGRHREEAIKNQCDREQHDEDMRLIYVALTRARSKLYLPCFPKETRIQGVYKKLIPHLQRVQSLPGFEVRDLARPALRLVGEPPRPLAAWRPEPALIAPPEDASVRFASLQQSHAAPIITSYTRMKEEARRSGPVEADDFAAERHADAAGVAGAWPAGSAAGICLHALLEELDPAPLADSPPVEAWAERPEVRALAASVLRRHDLAADHVREALRLSHAAYTGALPLPPALPLARAPRLLREVEFLYPYPGRGFIKGYFDVLFEHEGRLWFADWKSDLLAGYDGASLHRAVEERYALQARLYAIALRRLCGVTDEAGFMKRVGGLAYAFVRGMSPGKSDGVHVERPTFAQVVAWEEALA